jgi:hypothetical protein
MMMMNLHSNALQEESRRKRTDTEMEEKEGKEIMKMMQKTTPGD